MKSSNCPNCGAPLRPGSRRCEYCGSWFIPEKDEDFSEPVPVTYETENKYKIIISRTEPKSAEHGDIWVMPELPGNRGDGDPRIVTMRDENNMIKHYYAGPQC
jgi:hypothetical protein